MERFGSRSRIRLADLYHPLDSCVEPGSADLIVSGYAIHHLTHERKRSLYREIYDGLRPGGAFFNIEHVASTSPELQALFERLFDEHLLRRSPASKESNSSEQKERKDKSDNILERVETQSEWLREIGFAQVDCYFKWLELAVFGGVKPSV